MFHPVRMVLALSFLGLVLTGCSATVTVNPVNSLSKTTLEQGISDALSKKIGRKPDAVECPGPLERKIGNSIRCVLTGDGVRYGLTATINSLTDGGANYSVQVDNQPLG